MEVVMEEKERYKVSVGSDYITICDYEENRIKVLDNCGMQSLLNLQDNQIKAKEKEANTYAKEIVFLDNKIKLLKQGQKQLAIKELEKALALIQNAVNLESPEYGLVGLYDAIVDQIKSLKGEE